MPKSFTLPLSESPQNLIRRAQATAEDAGAVFEGDEAEGRFEGNGVVGSYRIEGNEVTVTITDKPFIAPWSVVESKVRGFFA